MPRQDMSIITAALRAADLAPSEWMELGDLAVICAVHSTPWWHRRSNVTATSTVTSPPQRVLGTLNRPDASH